MAAIAAGDRQAFSSFVVRHAATALRMGKHWTASEADAEDAVQQAFLDLWRSASKYDGSGAPRAYLLSIVRRSAFRTHRRRAGQPTHTESIEQLGEAAGWGKASPLFEDRVADRDQLRRALSALDAGDREVLLLRDVSGLSTDEVAETCELSVTQVKGRLHRARLRLLAALERYDEE